MRPWLKAGLMGGITLSVLTALGTIIYFVPQEIGTVVSCCVCFPFLLIYPAIGVLAALWMTPPRSAGQGAQIGALAGLVAGGVDSVFTFILNVVLALLGVSQQYLGQLPAEMFNALQETGLVVLFTPGGLIAVTLCGTLISLVWAVACGALGGAIYAGIKRE